MASALSKPEDQTLSHLLINMMELYPQDKDLNRSKHCIIYRAPCTLRKVKEEAYTPQLISIGPFHFDQQKFKSMHNHKLRYFHFFCVRVSDGEVLKLYKSFLETKEAEIRNCYAEKLPDHITKEKFVEMVLLDSVFIMELFLRMDKLSKHEEDDIIVSQTWLWQSIQRDLLLLENQIPMFVLDRLYETVPKNHKKHQCFVFLARNYFKCLDPYEKKYSSWDETKEQSKKVEIEEKHLNKPEPPLHFTDLIRKFYLCESHLRMKGNPSNVLRTATKLQEAGVSFEKMKTRHLLDIQFEKKPYLSYCLCLGCIPKFNYVKARLQIPQLKVDHMTECVLRNLIALEQCHYAKEPYICNYVSLIDSLIHTKDDVELLVEKEVIVHELGSDKEVATLVNGLCKHVVTDSTCYKDLIDDLNNHYQKLWNRTMAALRLVYFRDPWRASGTLVGIAVLVFTIFNFRRVVSLVF